MDNLNNKHVVLIGFPAVGHMIPLCQMADYLAEKFDCLVTVVGFPTTQGMYKAKHANVKYVKVAFETDIAQFGQLLETLEDRKIDFTKGLLEYFRNSPFAFKLPVTAVVYDQFSVWARCLAQALKVKHYLLSTCPSYFGYFFIHWHKYKALADADESLDHIDLPGFEHKFFGINDFPGLRSDPTANDDVKEEAEKLMSTFISCACSKFKFADGIVVNDMVDLIPPELATIMRTELPPGKRKEERWDAFFIGPLAQADWRRSSVEDLEKDETIQWLNKQPENSVVYVAFGSHFTLDPGDLEEFALGLEQSGCSFVWAYRPRAEIWDSSHLKKFVKKWAKGPMAKDGLPEGYRERLTGIGNGLIVPWVNQPAILAHPSVALFVSHCGWNSTIENFVIGGKPVYCLPQGADQFGISTMICEHYKMGRKAWVSSNWDRKLERELISKDLKEMMVDAELHEAGLKIKRESNASQEAEKGKSWLDSKRFLN